MRVLMWKVKWRGEKGNFPPKIINIRPSKRRRGSMMPVYDICRLQTADHRPQTADCRLQTANWRLQIADCKLKDPKNLPHKGDTIKNITSCESEKVAWEQGWYFCAELHWPHFQDAVGYSSPTRLFIDSSSISIIALILYSSLIIVNW